MVPLNSVAQEIVDRYAGLLGDQLLTFDTSERYNVSIKTVFEKAGVTYLVIKLVKDPNLVSALTGHVEGSRAVARYRTIEEDLKKSLVDILG